MKRTLSSLLLTAALLAGAGVVRAQQQQSAGEGESTSIQPTPTARMAGTEVADLDVPNLGMNSSLADAFRSARFASLSNGSTIALNDKQRMQWLYGFGYSHAWGDTFATFDQSYVKSSSAYSPYLGVAGNFGTTLFLAQYSGTITDLNFTSGTSHPLSSYHTGQFALMGEWNPRWAWSISDNGSYGNGMLKSIAPLSTAAVGNNVTGILDPSSADLSVTTNTVFGNRAQGKLDWRRSETETVHLTVDHAYYRVQGEPLPTDELGFQAEVERVMSRRWTFNYYGHAITPVNDWGCMSVGAGLGVDVQLQSNASLSMQGGPEWTRANCARPQSLSYSIQYMKNFGTETSLYASARRQRTVQQNYASSLAVWEDGVSVGMQHMFPKAFVARGDWGYARGTGLSSTDTYRSNFFSVSADHEVASYLSFGVSYRNYYNAVGPLDLNRNAVIFQVAFKHEPNRK